MVRHQAQGLVVFAIGLALTSGSLAALNAATSDPAHGTELAVLIAANLAATVLRFLLFRAWVFPEGHDEPRTPAPPPVVAAHRPDSAAARPAGPYPMPVRPGTAHRPPPRRPSPTPAATAAPPAYDAYGTAGSRARDGADRGPGDPTLPMRAVRPHDHDPRNAR